MTYINSVNSKKDFLCTMNFLLGLELTGTLVFAISGALTAAEKKFDLMGVCIIAFVTALGGGTVRDVLIGSTPVNWMHEPLLLIIVICGVLLAFLFNKKLNLLRRTFFLFDAMGLGLFSIAGMQIALNAGIAPIYAILCGMITGTFGGLTRDILCQEVPMIFRKEIYALAGLTGASLYYGLEFLQINHEASLTIAVLVVIAIRIFAVKYNLQLWRIKWEE